MVPSPVSSFHAAIVRLEPALSTQFPSLAAIKPFARMAPLVQYKRFMRVSLRSGNDSHATAMVANAGGARSSVATRRSRERRCARLPCQTARQPAVNGVRGQHPLIGEWMPGFAAVRCGQWRAVGMFGALACAASSALAGALPEGSRISREAWSWPLARFHRRCRR